MKQFLIIACIALLAACNSNNDAAKVDAMNSSSGDSTQMDNTSYPYTADYSHNFEIGSSKNAAALLELYKNWDNNTLDNAKDLFADVDTMVFSDGTMFTGSRDSLFAMAKQIRGQMGTVVDSVHAWVPLRSKDKNEEWVLIWTREISTDAKGKRTSKELQETWRFDQNGKINLVYQYEQQPPKMTPPPANK